MGWVELGRTGETQIILYSRKEDNERMHSLRTNRQDETGSDQVFVNIVRIKKKRERKGIRRSFNAFRNIIRLVSC